MNLETQITAEVGRQMSALPSLSSKESTLRVVSADDLRRAIEAGVEIGIGQAIERVRFCANVWRGAHVNTNYSCGEIIKDIKSIRDNTA